MVGYSTKYNITNEDKVEAHRGGDFYNFCEKDGNCFKLDYYNASDDTVTLPECTVTQLTFPDIFNTDSVGNMELFGLPVKTADGDDYIEKMVELGYSITDDSLLITLVNYNIEDVPLIKYGIDNVSKVKICKEDNEWCKNNIDLLNEFYNEIEKSPNLVEDEIEEARNNILETIEYLKNNYYDCKSYTIVRNIGFEYMTKSYGICEGNLYIKKASNGLDNTLNLTINYPDLASEQLLVSHDISSSKIVDIAECSKNTERVSFYTRFQNTYPRYLYRDYESFLKNKFGVDEYHDLPYYSEIYSSTSAE
jgi:hypothetical protein